MTRSKPGRGRTTSAGASSSARSGSGRTTPRTAPSEPDIPPLYKRRPGTFFFMLIAVIAMVLSMMVGIIDAVI